MPDDLPATQAPAERSPAHVPVLDGVRGLAILLVLLVHFTPDYLMPNRPLEWAKKAMFAGWTGVDLFFVLSGFLITGILLRVRDTPRWVRNFYWRRALRILPLYMGSLVIVFGILPLIVRPGRDPEFDAMQTIQGWFWVHAANVAIYFHSFASTASHTTNISHLWSLAVEEHFYLLWPFLVARLPERRLLPVLLAIIGVAIGFRLLALATLVEPTLTSAYVQTPTRMDALALGALLCVLLRRFPALALRRYAVVLLPLIGLICLTDFFLEKGLWPGSKFVRTIGLTLFAIFYASLIVVLLTDQRRTPLHRLINNGPMRFLGKYSYGIYVIHGLMVPTLHRWFPDETLLDVCRFKALAIVVCVIVKSVISIALALLSWRLVEAPCLRLKDRFDYTPSRDPVPLGATGVAT